MLALWIIIILSSQNEEQYSVPVHLTVSYQRAVYAYRTASKFITFLVINNNTDHLRLLLNKCSIVSTPVFRVCAAGETICDVILCSLHWINFLYAYRAMEFISTGPLNIKSLFTASPRFMLSSCCSFKVNECFVCIIRKVLKYSKLLVLFNF